MADMPGAEVVIDELVLRRLLADQHPDLAERPLRHVGNGWDNEMFQVGDDLLARLPRRAVAVPLILHERRWLGELATRVPLAIPAHVRAGRPGAGYPWNWAVVPWFEGDAWYRTPPTDLRAAAHRFAAFLGALHHDAPPDAPTNPFRGRPLDERAERLERALPEAAAVADLDVARCRAVFTELAAAPRWRGPPRWLHGDPHPLNLIVADGALTAVIDFGDICSGDPASDLAAAWIVLPSEVRADFRTVYAETAGLDEDTWTRARAWALALGMSYVAGSADHPAVAAIGRRAIATALADPA